MGIIWMSIIHVYHALKWKDAKSVTLKTSVKNVTLFSILIRINSVRSVRTHYQVVCFVVTSRLAMFAKLGSSSIKGSARFALR